MVIFFSCCLYYQAAQFSQVLLTFILSNGFNLLNYGPKKGASSPLRRPGRSQCSCCSSSRTTSSTWSTTPAPRRISLTGFAVAGVPLPLVGTAAVGGARRRDAGGADVTAGLYFDSSWWPWQGRRVGPYAQPNALSEEREVNVQSSQSIPFTFRVFNLPSVPPPAHPSIHFIRPHLYASFYPVLNLSWAQHSSHMQMFHLQTMNLISHYHCSLGREKWRDVRGLMGS